MSVRGNEPRPDHHFTERTDWGPDFSDTHEDAREDPGRTVVNLFRWNETTSYSLYTEVVTVV